MSAIATSKRAEVQTENLINYLASIKFANVNCEFCNRPLLSNGILYDSAICVTDDPQAWAHSCCYNRNN